MKKSVMAQFTVRLGLACLFILWGAASQVWGDLSLSTNSNVHIQADRIEYLKDQGLVVASGQVHIQQDQVHLYADKIRYDMTAQNIFAEGHVIWQDESQEIEAKNLTYNLRDKKGKAFDIKTTAPPWISTGSEIDIEDRKITIKNAITTTCDYVEGYRHYFLKSDRITIYSGDYLVAENVVMYIGKVPVFYFPFFVRTIHDLKTPFSISTGATDYLGNYILLTTNYLLSTTNFGALYSDYFFKKGIGVGLRHEIALNDSSVLSLYGYGIQEKDTPNFRWEGRARGLWALSSSFQGRVEADIPGDSFFSQDYSVARRDPSLVSTVKEFDVSTTLTRQQWTLGLLMRRQESADFTKPVISGLVSSPATLYSNYFLTLQNLPQLTFTLFPQPIIWKNWLKYDLTLQGDHTYTKANDYYVNHLSGELGISQSLLFLQNQTLYTRVGLNDIFQDVSDVGVTIGNGSAGETHSVNTQETWSSRWTEFFNTNFTHNFSQKINNLLPTDPPYGVTSDLVTGRLELTLGSYLTARTSTTYDLNAQVNTDGARFGYLREEFLLNASTQFDYSAFADYSMKAEALKDFSTILNLRSPNSFWQFQISGNFVDPNVSNIGYVTFGLPASFYIAGQVSFAFFTNYRMSALESYDLTNSKFITRSISFYRDLHDWEAELNYNEDPVLGKTVFFKLNLKAFPGRPLTVSDDQITRLNSLRNQGLTGAASQFQ